MKEPSKTKFHLFSNFRQHKICTVCLAVCVVLVICCAQYFSSRSKSAPTYDNDTQRAFDAYADALFQEQLSSDALSAHFYLLHPDTFGLDNIPQTLGNYTYEDMQNSQNAYIEEINSLQRFDYDQLKRDQQLTYDILLQYFRDQLDFADLCLCSEPLSPTTGIQAQLPILFSEYTFTNPQDVENYLTLLGEVESYYSEICEFQKIKAEQDSFLSDFSCDGIIAQCRDFINANAIEENVLYTSFDEKIARMDGLSESQKADFSARNRELLETSVLPAYQQIIDTLSALKAQGACKNANGLYYLKNGQDYYTYLVKNYTGSSKTVMELKAGIQSNLMADMRTMYSLLTISPELEDQFYGDVTNTMTPQEILTDLEQKFTQDFPEISDMPYTIKYVDESLQEYLSPAFYLSPPIDADNNVIYINQGKSAAQQDLYTTLAHEGIPGHMYQSCYFAQTNPLPIRQLISYGGYIEGWATYVEFLSYHYEQSNEQLAQALACSASYSLALYSLCDIGVNYEGWTLEDTKQFLSNYNLTDTAVCENIFQAVIEEPANYLQYYVGYMEIENLKEKMQKELGTDFDLKQFHKAFLSIGPASFDVVEKWLPIQYEQDGLPIQPE